MSRGRTLMRAFLATSLAFLGYASGALGLSIHESNAVEDGISGAQRASDCTTSLSERLASRDGLSRIELLSGASEPSTELDIQEQHAAWGLTRNADLPLLSLGGERGPGPARYLISAAVGGDVVTRNGEPVLLRELGGDWRAPVAGEVLLDADGFGALSPYSPDRPFPLAEFAAASGLTVIKEDAPVELLHETVEWDGGVVWEKFSPLTGYARDVATQRAGKPLELGSRTLPAGTYDVLLEAEATRGAILADGACQYLLRTAPTSYVLMRNGQVTEIGIRRGASEVAYWWGERDFLDPGWSLSFDGEAGRVGLRGEPIITMRGGLVPVIGEWVRPLPPEHGGTTTAEVLAANGLDAEALVPQREGYVTQDRRIVPLLTPEQLADAITTTRYAEYVQELREHPSDTVRVAIVTMNPLSVIDMPLSESYLGWSDPERLAEDFVLSLNESSNGVARYEIVERIPFDEYPVMTDGSVFTQESYARCLREREPRCNSESESRPWMDAEWLFDRLSLCDLVQERGLSEIWVIAPPWFGLGEYVITGPFFQAWNGGDPGTPSCGRTVSLMGFNIERRIEDMLHSYGHRAERVLDRFLPEEYAAFDTQGGRYSMDRHLTPEEQREALPLPPVAGCGNVHFPPNAGAHYEYGSSLSVSSTCDDWLDYPSLDGASQTLTCDAWGCTQDGFLRWWLGHIPHAGDSPDTNWWRFILWPDAP